MKFTIQGAVLITILTLGLSQIGCQVEKSQGGGNIQTNLVQAGNLQINDIKYMHGIVRSTSGSMRMDLSDPSQYRFLTARLAASGKTRKSSPRFFEMIDGIQRRHVAARQNGFVKHAELSSQNQSLTALSDRDHLVADVTRLNNTSSLEFKATTFATIKDGADYNFVDAVVWGEDGQQISDYGWGEEYADGKRLIAQAAGNIANTADAVVIKVDSVNLVSVNGVEEPFYTLAETLLPAPRGDAFHPRDLSGNGQVWVCLRSRHADCDYYIPSGAVEIKMPVAGSITLPGELKELYTSTSNTFVKLSGSRGGTHAGTVETGTVEPFGSKINISPDKLTLSWDVPNLLFKTASFATDGDVKMFIHIKARFRPRGRLTDVTTTFIMSSAAPGEPNASTGQMPRLPVIRLTWDCLAKGTKIQLSSKKAINVENVKNGMRLRTDDGGLSLPVSELSSSSEAPPMVRIVDTIGHELLLSTTHPIMTPDRGAVLAETLTVGSKVLTDKGVSTLVKVTPELYTGEVYNLKLDSSLHNAPSDGSTLYANGFLVGDLAMQQAVEFKTEPQGDVFSRLPKEWQTDYRNSTKVSHR